MPTFRSPGELKLLRAVEVDDNLKEVPNGVEKLIIFDGGTEKYVYTDPGRGLDYLKEVRSELYKKRKERF